TGSGRSSFAAAVAERRPDDVPGPRRAGGGRAVDVSGPGDPAAPLRRDPGTPAEAGPRQAGPGPPGAAVRPGQAAPAGAGRAVRGADPGTAGVADRVPPDGAGRLSGPCRGGRHDGPAAPRAGRVHLAAGGRAGGDPADLPAVGLRPAPAVFALGSIRVTCGGPRTRMVRMSQSTHSPLPREVADAYVDDLVALDPISGTYLGVRESSSRLPDLSPAGQEAVAELQRRTLARLDEAERLPGADRDIERRCARLLRERLTAELAVHEADEGLRSVGSLGTVAQSVREVFTVTPSDTEDDWATIAERLRAVPAALGGYRESLALGLERKLYAAPRPTATFVGQLTEWSDTGEGRGWFEDFAAAGPDALRAELDEAARAATAAVVELRDWMRDVYAPAVEGAPNTV